MRSSLHRLAGLPAAFALVLGALAADAGELRFRGQNQNLEEARALVGKARFEEALEELKTAEALPGNTNRHLADLYMLRAGALLGLAPNAERAAQAKDALVKLFHVDAEGAALSGATDAVKALAGQLKTERPIVLHDRLVTVRSGRPMRLRARLLAAPANAQLFVRYRTEPDGDTEGNADLALSLVDPGQFVKVALDARGADSFEVFLRPGVGGVPADGEHVMRYYLEAFDEKGALLDRNGSAQEPIRVQLSETRTEGSGVGGADAVIATLDEGGHIAHPPPPPPPPPPWYKRWEIAGPVGGAVVVVGIVAAVLLVPKPQAPSGALGQVKLP